MQLDFTGSVTAENILSLTDLKGYLRVDHTAEDTYIQNLRQSAINWVEDYCSIKLGSYTGKGYLDYFASSSIPVGPVTALSSVEYKGTSDSYATLGTGQYYYDLDSEPARIRFHNTPSLYEYALARIRINFTVGYAEASVPAPILQAMRMLVAHWYESRMAVVSSGAIPRSLQLGVEALLSTYRIVPVG